MANRLLPLLLITIILLLIDLYIYKALLTLSKDKTSKKTRWFKWIYWGYSFLLIIGVFASIYFNLRLSFRAVTMVAFVLSFVSKVCYLPFIFLDDIRRIILSKRKKSKDVSTKPGEAPGQSTATDKISRSEFILKAGLAVASIPFATLSWGIISGAYDYQVKRRTLYLKNLPKAFDGVRLAQISDVHSGSFYNKKAVLGGVETLLGEKPDFIFFTGDLVNGQASEMRNYQDIFTKVKAPLGVYSVLGNHDYGDYHYGPYPSPAKEKNFADLIQTHKNMGWNILLNESTSLKVDGEELAIIGVENWGAGSRFPKKADLNKALSGTEDKEVKLLLSHDPTHWRAHVLNYPDINAMFSGHTHGMQFGVRMEEFQWSPVQYIYKEWAGLYQENNQQLYVNVGYGFLGYPGRVGILPEITIFELKRA
ncbi:metallophosphoesterase [Desertivirga brevis]|uniref:metallophosphoesterase n=1 Tax=Desertivirga brevis TaxID=2810310 RepID=UPI001A965CD8|nr:metallophosphoesterase [Pedobacter sp. SYSU D00873]